MKNSFQNVVKRISAGFMASVIFAYSLLISPCFGVGAVNFNIADWVKSVGSAAISIASGGNTVASLVGTLFLNAGVDLVQSKVSTSKPEGFEVSQPLSNTSSFAGPAIIDGHDAIVTVYTRPATTLTYTDLWYDYSNNDPIRFRLCNAVWDGGSRSLYFSLSPLDNDDAYSWQDGDYVTIVYNYYYNSYRPGIYCGFEFFNSSGESVQRRYFLTFYSIYSTGATYSEDSSPLLGTYNTIGLRGNAETQSYSDYLDI